MLRDPSKRKINPVFADDLPKITLKTNWHTLNCELVTPMYGGGVESTKVDTTMPIRASSIRGQLRFWWRLLAKHKWKLGDDKAIRTAEFELWGGVSNGNDDGEAGKVLLKVVNMPTLSDNQLMDYNANELKGLRYILFPAYNETNPELKPHKLLKASFKWDLQFAFSPSIYNIHQNIGQDKPSPQKQVIETLRWWANFGGLGFRSRKGLGAVYVSQCQDFPQICKALTPDDVAQAGCQLVVRKDNPADGLRALQIAVQKLSDFRQKPKVGRNEGQQANRPGRSRWPEPDALRRIQRNLGYDRRHEPEHKAGNVFARAVFGLPILFHSHQERAVNATVNPSFGDRLASPLILRPIYAGHRNGQTQWRAGALVLPYKHILKEKVKIGDNNYPIWQDDTAQTIKPVREHGGIDPLQAFLTYFAK
ncbi:MAG: type III-B CRISPR module RAMP protein Cmr1 [Moraxella sp.]|nr:type III-B CRISPR module RAMP protein Cmr1 [Moraxella sp.]